MTDSILRGRGIRKDFRVGDRVIPVLKGIDIDVHPREVLAIVGPSGAGKSTLLHVLGLLEHPTAGLVEIGGRQISDLPSLEQAAIRNQRIGFVFQFYHLFRDLTALENVLLPRMVGLSTLFYFRNRNLIRQRALDLLERVGLSNRLDHRPSQLSGGERQRVAIARALMNEPDLLLCDEPTGNLDTETGTKILDLLFDLNRTLGETLVIVTHNDDLSNAAHRRIRVVDGHVVDETTLRDR